MKSIVIFLFSLFALISSATAQVEPYKASAPDWVIDRPLDTSFPIPTDKISEGVFYRIVDDQVRVTNSGEKQYFSRFAQTVANSKGLDSSSQIDISFDPTYEQLIIHDISIIRDGQRQDRYDSAEISLFQSEKENEQKIYNGTLTFNAILTDVMVGDTVDYSYTLIGSNPIYRGLFSTSRTLVWSVPVQDQYHEVLWQKDSALYVNQRNGDFDIQTNGQNRYSLQLHMENTLSFSGESPDWFSPRPTVYYSETENWQEVINWALPLYQNLGADQQVKSIAKSINTQTSDPKQQLALALRYVQDNIRYVGIEMGLNSHLPTPASETLNLKYGDCKDKTVLLLALMRELGLTGFPALVNTDSGQILNELPPSVTRFDHVIVNAVIGTEQYWLDPTMSNQIGPLDEIYQPDFGYALLVKDGQTELSLMDASASSNIEIKETYTIPKEGDGTGSLKVESLYQGWQSQSILSRLQNNGIESTSQSYLEFYQRSFPATKATEAMSFTTDNESGTVKLTEHYQIDNIFSETDEGFEIDFYAADIRSELKKPQVVQRNAPFSFNYPKKIRYQFVLNFEGDNWSFSDDTFEENNDFFHFQSTTRFQNNTLVLDYQYRAKQNHIPATEIQSYLAARDRVLDNSAYGIIKLYLKQWKNDSNY